LISDRVMCISSMRNAYLVFKFHVSLLLSTAVFIIIS